MCRRFFIAFDIIFTSWKIGKCIEDKNKKFSLGFPNEWMNEGRRKKEYRKEHFNRLFYSYHNQKRKPHIMVVQWERKKVEMRDGVVKDQDDERQNMNKK